MTLARAHNRDTVPLNERINNPAIRHGLLMVKKAGKDDISNIVHDRKHLITNSPFDGYPVR